MLYKTIVLQLLEQNPQIYEPLRRQRQMLPALEYYANELKTLHQAWKKILAQAIPGSDPDQIASEALERALKDLEDRLPSAMPPGGNEPLSLDAAMAYIRRHMPNG